MSGKNTIVALLACIALALAPVAGLGQASLWSLTWGIAGPTYQLSDYVNATSFSGLHAEGSGRVSQDIYIGGRLGWQRFEDRLGQESWVVNGVAIEGEERRYLDALELAFVVKFFPGESGKIRPYLGGGLGTGLTFATQSIGDYRRSTEEWNFLIFPEIGMMTFFNPQFGLKLSMQYHILGSKVRPEPYSWLLFDLGILFSSSQ